jgi:hypothetical protein
MAAADMNGEPLVRRIWADCITATHEQPEEIAKGSSDLSLSVHSFLLV